jgi:hypothetical protein
MPDLWRRRRRGRGLGGNDRHFRSRTTRTSALLYWRCLPVKTVEETKNSALEWQGWAAPRCIFRRDEVTRTSWSNLFVALAVINLALAFLPHNPVKALDWIALPAFAAAGFAARRRMVS